MKKIILPVFTESDLKAVPDAVRFMAAMGMTHLWVVHSPALGLPYPAATKALDEEITVTEQGIKLAVAREDYETAKQYRDTKSGLMVRRDEELARGYKSISPDDLTKAYDASFDSISQKAIPTATTIVRTALQDPPQPADIFKTMDKFLAEWPDELAHGQYVIAWPLAISETHSSASNSFQPPTISPPPIDQLQAIQKPEGSDQHGFPTNFGKLRKLAKEEGVHVKMTDKRPEIVRLILEKRALATA